MWPTLIFPPLCSHFSAAAPLHPSLIQPLKISFPTQLAFSLSRRCLGLSSPPLSSCGHFLFRPPIKIVIQVTERTSDHFTAGKKGGKASFKRPARLNAAGAFHLLLLVCVCLLFVYIFLLHLKGKISGQWNLGLTLWFIWRKTPDCRACKMRLLIISLCRGVGT